MENKPKFDLVLYHGGCPDGFTSAWVFKHYFPMIQVHGCSYGTDPPSVYQRRVAVVDFSFPRDQMLKMIQDSEYLVVLDHHASAEKNLANLDKEFSHEKGEIIFDMKRAGAQISWDYLYPNKQRPWFIEYVADRDLWKKELPYTEELSLAMWFDGYFQDFNLLENLFQKVPFLGKDISRHPIIDRGTSILRCKNIDIKNYANLACLTSLTLPIGKYSVRLVSCPRQYRSDVGNIITSIFKDCDFAGIYWYDHFRDEWWISLRSSLTCQYDLSDISNYFETGGGHKHAAGFSIKSGHSISDYFTNLEVIQGSPKPLVIPIHIDYTKREIDNYVKASKLTETYFPNKKYLTRLTCVPIHYHFKVLIELEKRTKEPIKGVYWYDFGRQLWTIRLISTQINFIDILGPYPTSFLGTFPSSLTKNILEWSFNDPIGTGLRKFFH